MMRTLLAALVIEVAACGPPSPLGTQTTIPDPPAAEEDSPAHERPDFFWIHGHWAWTHNHWDWTNGHWEHVRAGSTWTEGHWDKRGDTWKYTEGTWTAGDAPSAPAPTPTE